MAFIHHSTGTLMVWFRRYTEQLPLHGISSAHFFLFGIVWVLVTMFILLELSFSMIGGVYHRLHIYPLCGIFYFSRHRHWSDRRGRRLLVSPPKDTGNWQIPMFRRLHLCQEQIFFNMFTHIFKNVIKFYSLCTGVVCTQTKEYSHKRLKLGGSLAKYLTAEEPRLDRLGQLTLCDSHTHDLKQ